MIEPVATTFDEIMKVAKERQVSLNGFVSALGKDSSDDWIGQEAEALQMVGLCRGWIRSRPRIKSLRKYPGSYGYKHTVEQECERYICNGAFIIAAFLENVTVRRDEFDSPNATFNLGVRK